MFLRYTKPLLLIKMSAKGLYLSLLFPQFFSEELYSMFIFIIPALCIDSRQYFENFIVIKENKLS